MRSRVLGRAVALAVASAILGGTTTVLADDISNNLDVSVDAVAEVMSLNVGGANGTTQLYVVPSGGDGKPGCNLTGSTTLVVSVSSSHASVATVSPSSVTFTSCGFTQLLTITPHNQGSATISLSQTSNNTGGTFNLAPAAFTVNVAPPANTAPQVSVVGVTGGSSYEIGSVPAATCAVTDAEDGNSSFGATLSAVSGPLAAYGLGDQQVSCSYTDGGGLTASASVTYGIVDTTAPVIAFVSHTAANGNGWNNGNVTVTWSCTDSGSGVVAASVSETVSTEGANQSAIGTCHDYAGNTVSDTQTGINIDKTAPIIAFVSRTPPNGNGWNNGNVIVEWSCTDSGSGVVAPTVTQTVSTEGASQSATGTCEDRAENTASDTQTGINVDTTAPIITFVGRTPANGNGWNNGDVTVTWSCTDAGSGVAAASVSEMVSTEGANQSTTGTCTDNAGNTASDTQSGISIDKTAPSASASASPAANGNGWNNTNVTVSFSGLDTGGSGIDSCDAAAVLSNEAANQSASGRCTDKAGNVSALATASGINIDKTNPSVSLIGGPANGESYYFGSVPAAPTCSASDALSGLDGSCSVSGYSVAVGSHTVTSSATDMAGNSDSASASYSVLAWTLKGFFQPVDVHGTLNTVKGGSTVPLKFEVLAGSTELTDVNAVKSFVQTKIACETSATIDEIEVTTTGGTSLRYDASGGQFVQNWQTPKAAGTCYRVTLTTQDGSSLVALFKLK